MYRDVIDSSLLSTYKVLHCLLCFRQCFLTFYEGEHFTKISLELEVCIPSCIAHCFCWIKHILTLYEGKLELKSLQSWINLCVLHRAVRTGGLYHLFEINISACHLWSRWVRFPVKPTRHVIESATLYDSVGFLRGSGFLLHTLQISQYCLLS
jgi:hypothetical protein